METKLFEVRDSGTFIPVICIKLEPTNEADRFLLSRSGFGKVPEVQGAYILYYGLEGGPIEYDPAAQINRTRSFSHRYILDHWGELNSGDVIDVEWIMGRTSHKKVSEAKRDR